MNNQDLLGSLLAYAERDVYPFHMPGHKRNAALLGTMLPYAIDITEIEGFDNLHAPQGILKQLQARLAALWGARESFAMVNGATGGILAGMAATLSAGDKVLLARNCHKAVYHAVEMLGADPIYLCPPIDAATGISGSISPEAVHHALQENAGIRLVVLTSPTYDGVLSDVAKIVQTAHAHGVPVLVDEAHGAHLRFTAHAALSAVAAGADIVIQSLHKTLPALTQCAVAHLCGPQALVSAERFRAKLSVFETSSPSYVLLASMAQCVQFLETQGETAFAAYAARLEAFSKEIEDLQNLSVLCKGADMPQAHPAFFGFDSGKLPIHIKTDAATGVTLAQRLREDYALESEMAQLSYVLLMSTVCDTHTGFQRLSEALHALDATLAGATRAPAAESTVALPEKRCTPMAAARETGRLCPLEQAIGKTSLAYVWCYPPGAPMLVPGEGIDAQTVQYIQRACAGGLCVQTSTGQLPQIRVFN